MVGNNGLKAASPNSVSQASSATDLPFEALWESAESCDHWFDSHVADESMISTGAGSEGQSDLADAGRIAVGVPYRPHSTQPCSEGSLCLLS